MPFFAEITLAGTNGQSNFAFSFPYLSEDHLHVYLDGVETLAFTFLSSSTITLDTPLVGSHDVRIARQTPIDEPLVDYNNGSVIGESDLDVSNLQVLYAQQEVDDTVQDTLHTNDGGLFDAGNTRIINVGQPTSANDAVTKTYVDTVALSVSPNITLNGDIFGDVSATTLNYFIASANTVNVATVVTLSNLVTTAANATYVTLVTTATTVALAQNVTTATTATQANLVSQATTVTTGTTVTNANVVTTGTTVTQANLVSQATTVTTSTAVTNANVVTTGTTVTNANVVSQANLVTTGTTVTNANVVTTGTTVTNANVVTTGTTVTQANLVTTGTTVTNANVVTTSTTVTQANLVTTVTTATAVNVAITVTNIDTINNATTITQANTVNNATTINNANTFSVGTYTGEIYHYGSGDLGNIDISGTHSGDIFHYGGGDILGCSANSIGNLYHSGTTGTLGPITANVIQNLYHTGAGTLGPITANVISGNVTTVNTANSVTGNVGTITNSTITTSTGEVTGNVSTITTATGNVTGNVETITNATITTSTGEVTGNVTTIITATGNVTGNIGTVTNMITTANVISGNVTANVVNANVVSGNTTCNNFIITTRSSVDSYTGTATLDGNTRTAILSGASFTLTLYSAVDVEGQILTFIHSGTSLTQEYTIDGDGAETVDGTTTYILYTNGERLTIVSDGANWIMMDHTASTAWANSGPLTITATSVNPIKATVANTPLDMSQWRRDGDQLYFRYDYAWITVTAEATDGTGDYLVNLPTGITIATPTPHRANTTAWSATVQSNQVWTRVDSTGVLSRDIDYIDSVIVLVYDTTRFRVVFVDDASFGTWGAYGFRLKSIAPSAVHCVSVDFTCTHANWRR